MWYVALIIIVVLAVPTVLALRLAAAKRREQNVGAPSKFTLPDDAVPPAERSPGSGDH